MAVPETIIKREDIDGAEMVKRLEGCLGYLSSRAASNLNIPAETVKLRQMSEAIQQCQQRIRHIAPTRWHRTEAAPTGGREGLS